MILANLMSVKTDSDLPEPLTAAAPAAPAAEPAPAPSVVAPAPAPAPAAAPPAAARLAPPTSDEYYDRWCCEHGYTGDEGDEGGDDGYEEGGDDYDDPLFSHSGQVSQIDRLRHNFALFGLDIGKVIALMNDTSMVIGGGFMVNHILAMNGLDKPLCPNSDIDFYVYGGIPPIFHGSSFDKKAWSKHNSERIQAVAFRSMVTRRFYDLVHPLGYNYGCEEEGEYDCERTESGDRIFTTGSNIRMQVLTYRAVINGQNKKLNLVFSDTNMYDLITKVDISLTAGFFCVSTVYPDVFDYHHAAPQDVLDRRLKWMQPESTHTPRQKARMAKYRTRYGLLETLKMTTAEFIRDYDTLPDEHIHIELNGTEDEIHSKPVVRRVLGLPSVKFSVAMISRSILGDVTIYSNYPSAADRAYYAQHKAREAARVPDMPPPLRNPALIVHDDDEEE